MLLLKETGRSAGDIIRNGLEKKKAVSENLIFILDIVSSKTRENYLKSSLYLVIMNHEDFFSFFEENRNIPQSECKQNSACNFPDYSKKIVWIPPPKKEELTGVIISRDPTTGFIEEYDKASKKSDDEFRKNLMSLEKVPVNTIIDRLEKVCQREGKKFSRDNLSNFLLNHCYWTHLLKCYTYSKRKNDLESISFPKAYRTGCVNNCSEKWLSHELDLIFKLPNIKVTVLLGADVTKFVYRLLFPDDMVEFHEVRTYKTCTLIPLPHPSRANEASWTPSTKYPLLRNIEEIIKKCDASTS